MSTNRAPNPERNRDLAKIHIARKDLRLDDDTYRDILWTCARVRSSADLDDAGRRAVLEHFRARGWQPRTNKAKRKGYPGRPHNCDEHPQLRKIEALLTQAGRPWSYVDKMAQRMAGKDRIAFCNPAEWQKIIAALEFDKRRHSNGR